MKRLPAKEGLDTELVTTSCCRASLARRAELAYPFVRRLLSELRMSRLLILLGLILIAAGLLWPWIEWLKLGRLPGDIIVERQNFSFYFPITTGLLLSAILTAIFWLVQR